MGLDRVSQARDLTAVSIFDEATAVRRTGDGVYEMRPDPRFAAPPSAGGPSAVNGGVLIAAMLRAVLDSSPHPHPVATNAQFLRVPRIAPAQVAVTWLKHGKTAAVARVSLTQDGAGVIESTVATGSLDATGVASPPGGTGVAGTPGTGMAGTPGGTGVAGTPGGTGMAGTPGGTGVAGTPESLSWTGPESLSWTGEPPVLPPPAECAEIPMSAGIHSQVDLRLDPATAGWLKRDPGGVPEMRGWFRLRDGREPDACLLAFAVDAMPPVVFGLGALGWAPTVELTWHMRAVPAAGPLRLASRCRHVSGGWFDEESEAWDSAGRLVAQSRQLARVGRAGRG